MESERRTVGRGTVARLKLPEGATVLDVACGSGASALPAAERMGAQTRNALGLGAYTRLGQVGCGKGWEPLPQHVVVHDDDSSPWVVAGLMMDWPRLPAGSSAGIGHSDGLRRGALCLRERVG